MSVTRKKLSQKTPATTGRQPVQNNKNKKSVKFQGDMLNFCDSIQIFVFTTNHHLIPYMFILEAALHDIALKEMNHKSSQLFSFKSFTFVLSCLFERTNMFQYIPFLFRVRHMVGGMIFYKHIF